MCAHFKSGLSLEIIYFNSLILVSSDSYSSTSISSEESKIGLRLRFLQSGGHNWALKVRVKRVKDKL